MRIKGAKRPSRRKLAAQVEAAREAAAQLRDARYDRQAELARMARGEPLAPHELLNAAARAEQLQREIVASKWAEESSMLALAPASTELAQLSREEEAALAFLAVAPELEGLRDVFAEAVTGIRILRARVNASADGLAYVGLFTKLDKVGDALDRWVALAAEQIPARRVHAERILAEAQEADSVA